MADLLWVKEKQDLRDEVINELHERHREYRNAGIGLSATAIVLSSGVIIHIETFETEAWIKLVVLIIFGISILSALLIQACNYMGQKLLASLSYMDLMMFRLLEKVEEQSSEAERQGGLAELASQVQTVNSSVKEKKKSSDNWFTASDYGMYVAVGTCMVGLIIYGILLGCSFLIQAE